MYYAESHVLLYLGICCESLRELMFIHWIPVFIHLYWIYMMGQRPEILINFVTGQSLDKPEQ